MESQPLLTLYRNKQFFMFKIKQLTCTALAFMFVFCAKAQSFGEIHGKVVDSKGKAVPGAIVTADNSQEIQGTGTDEDGKFKVKPLRAGKYDVMVLMSGYDTLKLTGVIVEPEKIVRLAEFVLNEVSIEIGTIEIGIYKVPLIRYDGDHIQTMTAEELKNNPSANGGKISQMVAAMSSDIKPDPNGEDLYFRGSRAGSVLYFIDGVKSRDSNISIPSSGISSLSVYTGGMPAKYGDTTGGVIVVETKSYLEEYYKSLND